MTETFLLLRLRTTERGQLRLTRCYDTYTPAFLLDMAESFLMIFFAHNKTITLLLWDKHEKKLNVSPDFCAAIIF